jgi:copper(I)-binding protein
MVLLVALLGGCGSGQVSQTASQQAGVTGAFGDAGDDIALRDAWIPVPSGPDRRYVPGSQVPVVVTIVNHGNRPDELVGVSSPAAEGAAVTGLTLVPPGRNVVSTLDSTQPPVSPLVRGTCQIVLTANRPLTPGPDIPVTFRFRDAGEVTLPVPMATQER